MKSKIFKNPDEPMQSLNTRHVKLSNNCNWWNNWYRTVPRICVVRLVKPAVSNVSLLNTKVIFILYDAAIGEMFYAYPTQHTFVSFISRYLGPTIGHFTGFCIA